jgi:DnaJ-domain-containing protein 1
MALRLKQQQLVLTLKEPEASSGPSTLNSDLLGQVERLRNIVSILSFIPLEGRITTPNEALYILGFAPDTNPDIQTIRARYRKLAGIHHPDSSVGNTTRMTQLNAALDFLCK